MELKKVNTNNGNFSIHENLKGEDAQEAFIKSLSEEERASLVQLYPPFFLRKEETVDRKIQLTPNRHIKVTP